MGGVGTAVDVFEAERAHLTAVAYRMLGSWAEAEDAVQEAWTRLAAADLDEINEPAAWLTTVVARICLDVLRSARVRREAYVGPWLPEPLVARLPADHPDGDDPAETVSRQEDLGIAMLLVMERLTPEQRVAFVLHDAFSVPFDEIATALGTTPEAARQLASRARRAISASPPPVAGPSTLAEQRRAVLAFLAAAQSGDFDALLAVLAPDAILMGDGGGVAPAGPRPVEGAVAVARFVLGLFRRAADDIVIDLEEVLVNGDLGLLVEVQTRDGSPLPSRPGMSVGSSTRAVMAFAVVDNHITAVFNQLNPAKLTQVPTLAALRTLPPHPHQSI